MKAYRTLPPDRTARVYLTVPLDETADARLLGCKWDRHAQSWWIGRDSIANRPYVSRWMDTSDPLRAEARAAYKALERENERKLRPRRGRQQQRSKKTPNARSCAELQATLQLVRREGRLGCGHRLQRLSCTPAGCLNEDVQALQVQIKK